MRKQLLLTAMLGWTAVVEGRAQFSAAWLQDEKYWGDGKAEFNLYDAEEVRYGQARASEVTHIFVREPFSDRELVKAEAGSKAGRYPVLKLNQILHVPTGIYVYQQMHSAFWRVDSGALVKATLTSNDGCGNTYKEFRAFAGPAAWLSGGWRYEWRTYWEGMSAGEEKVRAPRGAMFYDELPMRVRMIDFAKGPAEFDILLAPTVIKSKKDTVAFVPMRVNWKREGDRIRVSVAPRSSPGAVSDKPLESLLLEARPPHLLHEWRKADGSKLRLRRSLKIDYWNYNKLGDKERALTEVSPMPPRL